MTAPTQAQASLQRAWKVLKGMDPEVEAFHNQVTASARELQQATSLGSILAKRISSGMSTRKDKKRLEADLDLIDRELQAAEAIDADAVFEIEYEGNPIVLSVELLRAAATARRGDVELLSGSPKTAIPQYEKGLAALESADVYLRMGLACEMINQPARALRAFERAAELDPTSDDGVEAPKEANRLRSQMFLGGWFVGSKKVLFALLSFTALFVLVGLGTPPFFFWAVIFAAAAVAYWLAKFRKPLSTGPWVKTEG